MLADEKLPQLTRISIKSYTAGALAPPGFFAKVKWADSFLAIKQKLIYDSFRARA